MTVGPLSDFTFYHPTWQDLGRFYPGAIFRDQYVRITFLRVGGHTGQGLRRILP